MKAAPASTEMRDGALVLMDAIEEHRDLDADGLRQLAHNVLAAAVGQWFHDTRRAPERRPHRAGARHWPARHGFTLVWTGRARIAYCLFCDLDVNELSPNRGQRVVPAAWITGIEKHTIPCAIRWLAQWAPRGPRGVRQTASRK